LEETLRQSEANLRRLASQLLTVQEQERTRIAQGLHDELGQALIILKMKLRAMKRQAQAENPSLHAQCEELLENLEEISENVRRISRDLSPYMLSDLGLEAALQRLLEEFSKQCRITLEFNGDLRGLDQTFPVPQQIHIFRIFQECLTNIAKHSDATMLKVDVTRENTQVSFFLEDNGRGFDLTDLHDSPAGGKGIGLTTLEERARLLGGSLSIASKPGQGTRMNLVLPIKSQDQR